MGPTRYRITFLWLWSSLTNVHPRPQVQAAFRDRDSPHACSPICCLPFQYRWVCCGGKKFHYDILLFLLITFSYFMHS